jgi:tetratricopeptide (TPR) repeat protein
MSSEALGKEVITESWIYKMERNNEVPDNPKRRQILAWLLDIPPCLFGLESLEQTIPSLFRLEKVDVQEYRLTLEHYCQGWHSASLFQAVNDMKARIDHLYRAAPNSSEKREMYKLLCGYLILLAGLAHSHMEFDTAIDHLNSAVNIAEEEQLYDLWAYALSGMCNLYMEQGEITAGLKGYPAAQCYFAKAVQHFQAAQELEKKVQPIFRGCVLKYAGVAYAYIARDKGAFDKALEILDTASKDIGKQAEDLPIITTKLDEERYHLDKAAAYLAYPGSKASHAITARNELKQAANKSIHSLDRDASSAILLAKSYLIEGKYEMAAAYTEAAIHPVLASGQTMNMARLDAIYQQLRDDPAYGKKSDVIMLGVNLLKAQEPELFH